MDTAEYCREIETYLCRKNEGHLVRIVGPAFELVCGWATRGVPLKIVFRGIDQYCERYYAKGPRRRPIRIDFCEGDILDLFDAWRRAIGVAAGSAPDEPEVPAAEPAPRKPALASHIERAIARLATVHGSAQRSEPFNDLIASTVRELESMNGAARLARGDARTSIIGELARLDRRILDAATAAIDDATTRSLRREADAELAPFGARLAPEARTRAVAAAFERLLRETLNLPVIAYEQ
jgi:hypothetical protein